MPHSLDQHLLGFMHFSETELALISENFETLPLEKDEHYLREGQICKVVGYVEQGLLMYYKVAEDGSEIVCDFAQENDWATQYESFINKSPSAFFVKAIEPTRLKTISLEGLNRLYQKIPAFEKLAKQLVEKAFMDMIKKSVEFQNLRAEDRYDKMVKDYPALLQRVPQYYIASFLGVAPQSLSRIRNKKTS